MKKTSNKKGAVLLIAILVSSVALAVGLGVYERTYKELLFASFWKQTQIAFTAADGGLECAIYRDSPVNVGETECFNIPFAWTPATPVLPATSATWAPADLNISGGCVKIEVTKYAPALPDGTTTQIKARGYNTCDASNPRRVERGLGVRY